MVVVRIDHWRSGHCRSAPVTIITALFLEFPEVLIELFYSKQYVEALFRLNFGSTTLNSRLQSYHCSEV